MRSFKGKSLSKKAVNLSLPFCADSSEDNAMYEFIAIVICQETDNHFCSIAKKCSYFKTSIKNLALVSCTLYHVHSTTIMLIKVTSFLMYIRAGDILAV